MRKGKGVIGKPILSLVDGTKLNEVKDLILGPQNDALVGLLADEGGLFASSQVVPIEEVASFGRDAVVVRRAESVVTAGATPGIKAIVDRDQSLLGTRVYTDTGDAQGAVSDIYFDEATGRVVGMEVSNGVFSDMASGTRYLDVADVVKVGRDVVYVRPETADRLQEQRGGVQGAVSDAGEKVRDAASKTKGAGNDGDQPTPENTLIGKRTGSDVEDDAGSVIVPAGRRITADDVERAEKAGTLGRLTASATAGEAASAAEGAKDAIGNVADSAAGLWDAFTRKLGETKDATGARVDEEQTKRRLSDIEDAVGRPVTKVILDLEDQVVLDLGDLITHTAIQRAHDAGSLESLLGCVYKGEVSFGKDEMRANRPAQAELEQASQPGISAPVVQALRAKVDDAERQRTEEAEAKKQSDEDTRSHRAEERDQRRTERAAAAKERTRHDTPSLESSRA